MLEDNFYSTFLQQNTHIYEIYETYIIHETFHVYTGIRRF